MERSGRLRKSHLATGALAAALAIAAPTETLSDAVTAGEAYVAGGTAVPTDYPASIAPRGAAAGDVDNDGDVDLADYVQFAAHYAGYANSSLDAERLPSGITAASFINREYLCRPGRDSITVNMIPAQNLDAYVEYRVAPDGPSCRTEVIYNHPANEALAIVLPNLREGTPYRYRVRARSAGCLNFEGLEEHQFTTARRSGETFAFLIGADSHVAKLYLCGRACRDTLTMSREIVSRMAQEEADFFIDLGDTAMTHIWRDGYPAETQQEADARYRIARAHLEGLSAKFPTFFVLGNHEGETGFSGARHSDFLTGISTAARLRYTSNPPNGVNALENFYAFEWGDALFIVLDPFRYTNVGRGPPDDPLQWTLGEEQLAWLTETMNRSDRTWKFLFAHHLVGGAYEPSSPYPAYGEGGAQCADVGEQAQVQELMERYGGHFFYGHNHLFAHGVNDGVHYILTSAYGGELHTNRMYLFEYENVIAEHGYTKVYVAPDRFTFRFIRASGGDVLYEYTVYGP